MPDNTQALLDLISKRSKLQNEYAEQLADLDKEIIDAASAAGIGLTGLVNSAPARTQSNPVVAAGTNNQTPVRRGPGRPKGSTNAANAAKRGPGRPKGSTNDKQPSLEEVIAGLVQRHRHGLQLHELVSKAIEGGYKTSSDNFTNMVQQAITRMTKKKMLTRDNDTMKFHPYQREVA